MGRDASVARARECIPTSGIRHGSTRRRSKIAAVALAGVSLFSFVGIRGAGHEAAAAVGQAVTDTGFTSPFSGTPRYEHLAPTEITNRRQLNEPIGQRAADELAKQLGLSKADTFTREQYREFVTGKGVGGDPAAAKLVDESVRILTNTVGRPLYSNVNGHITPTVLASYGLFVNTNGLLESPANADAPTRQVNAVIAPGGYLGRWCRANGATASLVRLYKSAYTLEAVYGYAAQQQSGVAQLVTTTKKGVRSEVGMSMAPSLWLVNFALLYTLKPAAAAKMPAHWAPIPPAVADAIVASPTGQVPFSDYASFFGDHLCQPVTDKMRVRAGRPTPSRREVLTRRRDGQAG